MVYRIEDEGVVILRMLHVVPNPIQYSLPCMDYSPI